MFRYRELVAVVESIYQETSLVFSTFQRQTELHCLPGCGACCLNPAVSASVLEMLPAAYHLAESGQLAETIEKLKNYSNAYCFFYTKDSEDGEKGHCSLYAKRAMICRTFAVAGVTNKRGEKTLSICRKLRSHYPNLLERIEIGHAPLMSEYARRFYALDPYLAKEMPINQALTQALLLVDQELFYQTIDQSN